MLIPVLRDRTEKPPFGTRLRTDGHWSVQGLVGSWAFNEGAERTVVNGVNGKLTAHTRTNTDSRFVIGRYGYEYESGASGGATNTGFYESNSATLFNRFSVVSLHKIHTTNGSLELVFGNMTSGGTLFTTKTSAVTAAATLCYDNSKGYVFCADGSGLGIGAKSGSALPPTGVYCVAAGVYDGGFKVYVNGALAGSDNLTVAGSFSGTFNCNGFAIADNPNWENSAHQFHVCTLAYSRALSAAEVASLSANPWQVYEPEVVWVDMPATGGTTYTEGVGALITAGISVADTTAMVDALTVTAQAADSVTDLATRAESLLSVAQAADSVAAIQTVLDALVTTAAAEASVVDQLTTAGVENLQTTAAAVATVQDAVVLLEQISTAASAVVTVTDQQTSALAENLTTAATAIASVSDLQLMVDNLTIMATSGASIGEIGAYLEQLVAAATGDASVTDVLVGPLVAMARLRVTARDPLALRILARDPLALSIAARDPLRLAIVPTL